MQKKFNIQKEMCSDLFISPGEQFLQLDLMTVIYVFSLKQWMAYPLEQSKNNPSEFTSHLKILNVLRAGIGSARGEGTKRTEAFGTEVSLGDFF